MYCLHVDSEFINLLSTILRKEKHAEESRVDVLPQRTKCKKCGEILYADINLKPPHEIFNRFNGRCPKCGSKLSSRPIKVEIQTIK